MNVSEVIIDADLAEIYQVVRSTGDFVAGGWQDQKQSFNIAGVVTVSQPVELEQLPEADRVHAAMTFYSAVQLYATHLNAQGKKGVSDILVWNGDKYRVLQVFPYGNRGYWKAIAVRMAGN